MNPLKKIKSIFSSYSEFITSEVIDAHHFFDIMSDIIDTPFFDYNKDTIVLTRYGFEIEDKLVVDVFDKTVKIAKNNSDYREAAEVVSTSPGRLYEYVATAHKKLDGEINDIIDSLITDELKLYEMSGWVVTYELEYTIEKLAKATIVVRDDLKHTIVLTYDEGYRFGLKGDKLSNEQLRILDSNGWDLYKPYHENMSVRDWFWEGD